MNLLLPVSLCENKNSPECRTVKFELSASNGCYEWSISHPHLVGMIPAKTRGQCVDSVILEPLINRDSKTLIWITAKDKNSGQLLESQVKLGIIDRISINVNYKHFYVNDKKHVDLVAFDDQGNIFSGLEGFRFDWSIQSGAQHMKIIPKPEGYDHPSKGSEVTFVRGLSAGAAELKVQILEPIYEKAVTSTSVTFMVVDPFIIEPIRAVYILPTSEYKLSLAKLKKSDSGVVTRENIPLPSKQYLWSIPSDQLGTISQDGVFVSRVTEGKQEIFVVDQLMTNNTSEGQLNIVFPYKISMKLKDVTLLNQTVLKLQNNSDESYFQTLYSDQLDQGSDSNILIEDRIYLVQLSLFDKDGNSIQLTKNLRFESEGLFTSDKINKLKVNLIGSEIIFQTTKIQQDQVKIPTTYKLDRIIPAKEEVFSIEGRELLKIDAEFILTKPVEIVNPTNLILLPYLPGGQTWQVSAKGGSGVYSWSVQNPTIASVEGSAIIKSLKIGKTKLQLSDHRNKQNFATIDVEVASVNQLKWLEDHIELKSEEKNSIGEQALISLIAQDRLGRKFINCTSLETAFEIKGEGNLIAKELISNYESVANYVASPNITSLLFLKQKFDENQNKVYATDLPDGEPRLSKKLIEHNNFGICSQTKVQASLEGLGRVKATSKILLESGNQQILESEYAEFAVYKPLTTVQPQIEQFYSHLYSKSQVGQEFANFDSYFSKGRITLLPGTEMQWLVSGGSNFWQDYQGKYTVDWKVSARQQPSNTNSISLNKVSETITKVQMKIQCLAGSDLQQINRLFVILNQSTKQSRQLLRPAQHQIKLEVDCGSPKSSKLHWSQPTDLVTVDLPNSRLVQDERTHFVLMGSKHYVETIFFDEQQVSYINSSSVVTTVLSSDNQLVSTSMTDKKFSEAVRQNRQAKREVQFQNLTGRVQLKSISSGYQKQMLNLETSSYALFSTEQKDSSVWNLGPVNAFTQALVSTLNVEVVKNVEIEPNSKSIYIGSTSEFRLTIKEGSGHFAVSTSDPELAQVTHKDREIFVMPKKEGQLYIQVEDLLVPGAEIRSANILISDIEKIFIWSPHTLIEQGNSMNLIVTAIDSDHNEFELDQYADMKFEIETEMTTMNKDLGLKTETTNVNTQFIAFGNEPGIYQLTAFSSRFNSSSTNQKTVVSEMLKIEVFPLLEIFPAELLLTPAMRYTLQIVGGPQSSILQFQNGSSVEIKFEIDDQKIASVDLNREVTAHQVGNATLKYQIIQQRGHKSNPFKSSRIQSEQLESGVVSKKQVPIRVRLVTDIEIPQNHKRLIYTDTLIKLNVVLKHGKEQFTNGIAPISYNWNCSLSSVLNLELPTNRDSLPTGTTNSFLQKSRRLRNNLKNDDNFLFSSVFNSSSIYAKAGKEGDAPVYVTLAIEYPNIYRNDQNLFQTSATVKVASRLSVQVNKDSISSQESFTMFLLPPNSLGYVKANLNTKLKLGYSIVSVYDRSTGTHRSEEATTPLVKLVDNKAIQTFEKYGKVTVVIEQGGQAFSDQIAMLNVFIADIFSLQVMNGYDALNMPLGSVLKLPIHFQNEHANRFADNIEGPRIAFSLSHPKVVNVEVDSFTQQLTLISQGQGDCNILVYLESNPGIFDILRVRVSSIVRPLSPVVLHVGGLVNFKVINPDEGNSDFQEANQDSQWLSSDTSVLTIDSDTGKAIGRSEGKTEVILSNHVNAASIVHVGKIQFGQIEHKHPLVLNTDESKSNSALASGAHDVLRVRVKLYFTKDGEEVMPTQQYSGITLVQQNIGLRCATNHSDHINVEPQILDLEGYFCVITYKKNSNPKSMPRFVKVVASAFSLPEGSTQPIYQSDVAQFEVQLLSTIKVDNKFKNGVKLNGSQRQEKVHIFSSSEFLSSISSDDEEISDLLKIKVTREDMNSNDYTLTLIVPPEVDHDFTTSVVLTHPYTKFERVLPVSFVYNLPKDKLSKKTAQQSAKQQEPDYEDMPKPRRSDSKGSGNGGLLSYLVMFLLLIFGGLFVAQNIFGVNVTGFVGGQRAADRDEQRGPKPSRIRSSFGWKESDGIREPQRQQAYQVRGNLNQSSLYGNQNSFADGQGQSARQGALNLDNYDKNRRSVAGQNSGIDRSRFSIYSNSSPYN